MNSGKKYIPLKSIVDIANYNQSFNKWIKIRQEFQQDDPQTKQLLYKKYLHVIKPIIGYFHQVVTKFNQQQIGFYDQQTDQQSLDILKNQMKLLRRYEIIKENPGDAKLQVQSIVKKQKQLYRMDLTSCPQNQQLPYWDNLLDVPHITFEGEVIKGKGLGTQTLGMPTANLAITTNLGQVLRDYPNGIYDVDFIFSNGEQYVGAGSLGTNPQYENLQNSRVFQAYILHDFQGSYFYGQNVQIRLKKLIRFEGKFHNFSSFLNAMHNDIQTIRLLYKLDLPSKI